MGVGDFQVTGSLPKVGGSGGGVGLPKLPGGGRGRGLPGFLSNMNPGMGGGVGGAVQPIQPPQSAQPIAPPQAPPPYTGGAPLTVENGQVRVLGQSVNPPPAQPQSTAPRDWYGSAGAGTRVPPGESTAPRGDWDQSAGGMTNESLAQRQTSGITNALMQQLLGTQAAYDMGSHYANANYGLDSQKLGLKGQLGAIAGADIGIDKQSNRNRFGGVQQDSEFLRQQRALYGDQLANQLAQIDTRLGVDQLDHENAYASGGSWFTPGQKYRSDALLSGAEQNRTDARLGTQMSQLGVDRSLAGNDVQMRELDFDMGKLDNALKSNGINLQQLGLDQQQLALGLQQQLDQLGLSQFMSATDILNSASQGGTEQSDYAMKMLLEWLQGGGQGQLPTIPMGA